MANIILRLTGGSSNIDPNSSLGGAKSTDSGAIINTANTNLNNLFDNISKLENSEGTVDYRCIMIENDTGTTGELFANGAVFLEGAPKAIAKVGFGTYNTNATTIANENTPPAGITFSIPIEASPLVFPDDAKLDPGEYLALWIERTAQNVAGAGTITDIITLVVRGIE
ncbi:MAG: hypothetical protein DRP70_14960 [Spirochaetes bacterium]|nr:MAG: hypothetical protein DRP70_14960 [Spirochaetota bacterium]